MSGTIPEEVIREWEDTGWEGGLYRCHGCGAFFLVGNQHRFCSEECKKAPCLLCGRPSRRAGQYCSAEHARLDRDRRSAASENSPPFYFVDDAALSFALRIIEQAWGNQEREKNR